MCNSCGKKGDLAKVCHSKKVGDKKKLYFKIPDRAHKVQEEHSDNSEN